MKDIVQRIKEELSIEKVPEELWTCEQKAFVELAEGLINLQEQDLGMIAEALEKQDETIEEHEKKIVQTRYDISEIMEQLEEK